MGYDKAKLNIANHGISFNVSFRLGRQVKIQKTNTFTETEEYKARFREKCAQIEEISDEEDEQIRKAVENDPDCQGNWGEARHTAWYFGPDGYIRLTGHPFRNKKQEESIMEAIRKHIHKDDFFEKPIGETYSNGVTTFQYPEH